MPQRPDETRGEYLQRLQDLRDLRALLYSDKQERRRACQNEYQNEYRQRPEVREKRREYNQRPEVKARACLLRRKRITADIRWRCSLLYRHLQALGIPA